MRVLCAALAGAGFLMPTIAVARELAARGHELRFVTDRSQTETLAQWHLARLPRSANDGSSFTVAQWSDPLHVAMQFAHLQYAAARFAPDVVVASHLTLGPVAFCTRWRLPLVVVGPITYLWPLRGPVAPHDVQRARTATWRYAEFRSAYRAACHELHLPCEESLLLGDRYLLQSVPELDPDVAFRLPPHVRQVGACTTDSPRSAGRDVHAWLEGQRAAGRPVVLVQLGRMFGVGDPWPAIVTWALRANVALLASLERYDAPVGTEHDQILIRNGVALEDVVAEVDFVICSGTPSPLLAAALAGKPALIATAGSGTEEHAAAFARYGAALCFSAAEPAHVARLADRLAHEPIFARRARALQAAYKAIDGPRRAADEVECAVGVPA